MVRASSVSKTKGGTRPILVWFGLVSVVFLLLSTFNELSKDKERRYSLFTAPHAEFAPFQRVWNPDTNNDYSTNEFEVDNDSDENGGVVEDDVAGTDGKFTDVAVPPFNGEDYFDDKPIGCCHDKKEQAIWSKWLALKNKVAKMEGIVRALARKKNRVSISYKLDPAYRGKPGPPGPQGADGPQGPQGAAWIDCDTGFWNTDAGICVACTNKPENAKYTSNANLFSPNTCSWECGVGFVLTDGSCMPCNSASCDVGQFRGRCSQTAHGSCQSCTNGPPHSKFIGSGDPFDSNTCPWTCQDGFFRTGSSCAACSTFACPAGHYRGPCTDSSDGVCIPCTSKPADAIFTGGGVPYNQDICLWACSTGFFKKDNTCASCSTAACAVGLYRAPCSPSQDGVCQRCTNKPSNSEYTGPGMPFNANTCSWRCKKGFKTSADGRSCESIRYFDQCDPTSPSWDRSRFQLCVFKSASNLDKVPKVGDADIEGSPISFVSKGQMPVVSIRTVNNFKKYASNLPASNYAWVIYGQIVIRKEGAYNLCITSSDGSVLYVDGAALPNLVVNNEGFHGMQERCAVMALASGPHIVYIEGWKGTGSTAGIVARYSGPDTNGRKILMRSGAVPADNRFSPSCVPSLDGTAPPFEICVFRSEVHLGLIPYFGGADTGENRLYFVGRGKLPVVDMHSLLDFRQYVSTTPSTNYAWVIFGELKVNRGGEYTLCISSDDGSRLYTGRNTSTLRLLVDDEGLHGMLEKCTTKRYRRGGHLIYVEGFQAGGGVGMEVWYSGPDTADKKVPLRSGVAYSASREPSVYYPECDPTAAPDSTSWTMCIFRSEVSMSQTPNVGDADTGVNRLYFVGKGTLPVINLKRVRHFRKAVKFTPRENFAWAIYGKLVIGTAGDYQLCITSDDGSRLSLEGKLVVDNEGLHGMVEKCSTQALTSGPHLIYIDGFQAGGGVVMKATYSGPDTDGSKVLMLSGRSSTRYYADCDPTKDAIQETKFTMCTFKSKSAPRDLSHIPRIGDRVATGGLRYLGKGYLSAVDMHSFAAFRGYVAKTPNRFYAWAIYGRIQIAIAGQYELCLLSDDGSNLFVDGSLVVQNDGLHGMSEKCASTNLNSGAHLVYIEGFQNEGGVGMEAKYSGPDTGNRKIWMQSGVAGFLGRAKSLPAMQQPTKLKISDAGGKAWKAAGDAIGLNSGNEMSLDVFADHSVWLSQFGWFGLFSGGQRSKAVRHSGYVMWTSGFAENNWDFAWKLVAEGDGYRIKSNFGVTDAHGGGWWVGYDKGSGRVLIVSASDERRVSWKIEPKPDPVFVTPQYYRDCDPASSKPDDPAWAVCVFRSEVPLDQIPTFGEADTGLSRLYFSGKSQMPAVDMHRLRSFRQYVPSTPRENYAWTMYGQLKIAAGGDYKLCISSDDGSRLSIDSQLVASNDGAHGMQEVCATLKLDAGPHPVVVDGWQGGGGVGMEATYSGPDTNGKKLYIRVGSAPNLAAPPRRYYPKCDPSAPGADLSRWTMCTFRSEVDLAKIPALGSADVATDPENRLYYVGQGRMQVVNIRSLQGFERRVKYTPRNNFAWAIYGKLEIGTAGLYALCIASDDGSKLYLDGDMVVDHEGLHGMSEKCTKTDLTAGPHVIYIEGFQAGGDAAMTAMYSGPDTGDQKMLMMSGRVPNRYYKDCDPTAGGGGSPLFTMCTFRVPRKGRLLRSTPRVGDAVSRGRIRFVGKGQLAVVDLHRPINFRQYVRGTPTRNFAWAIYGNLLIEQPGKYTLCISSDDGSKLYLDGPLIVDNEGIHGMAERCGDAQLEAGAHKVYVEGFQAEGGVGMELRYMGPDTAEDGAPKRVFMRSGALPPSLSLRPSGASLPQLSSYPDLH